MSDDLLATNGRCRACGGIVTNSSNMKGTSRAKLAERHAAICPGLARGVKGSPERYGLTDTPDEETL